MNHKGQEVEGGLALKPLIVRENGTILVEKNVPEIHPVIQKLDQFARCIKETDVLYTYQWDECTLWQAAADGIKPEDLVMWLKKHAKFILPSGLIRKIQTDMKRFGVIRFEKDSKETFLLVCLKESIIERIKQIPGINKHILQKDKNTLVLPMKYRGFLKEKCVLWDYPPLDTIGHTEGAALSLHLKTHSSFSGLRAYQQQAVESFCHPAQSWLTSGVILLPCGSGKTVVALGIMEKIQKETLILTPNITSCRQWIRELKDKTDLPEDSIGEYTSLEKKIAPVTVTTYQMLAKRDRKTGEFPHMHLFRKRDWGLIIYDEVHLLPAPVFRVTADLQAKRRLGLTAALVREDGREKDVFSLIGPVIYASRWKEMEDGGWISEAVCHEVRIPFSSPLKEVYLSAERRHQYRLAAENPLKVEALKEILKKHQGEQILVIGQYVDHLKDLAAHFDCPLITGATPQPKREEWYRQFRKKEISVLFVSKVANMAIDLPDAAVAIQVSGTFGSRQEEAQRLGRILRPKSNGKKAYFYQLVTEDTVDQEYACKRQTFLREKGYHYAVVKWGGT